MNETLKLILYCQQVQSLRRSDAVRIRDDAVLNVEESERQLDRLRV